MNSLAEALQSVQANAEMIHQLEGTVKAMGETQLPTRKAERSQG